MPNPEQYKKIADMMRKSASEGPMMTPDMRKQVRNMDARPKMVKDVDMEKRSKDDKHP